MEANLNLQWHWKALHDAYFDDAKYVSIRAGRRVGKTYNGFQWLIEELLDQQMPGLWVDTVHNNIDAYVERYLNVGLPDAPPILKPIWEYCHWSEKKKVLKLPNGSFIQFGSAERPELLEGFEYPRIVVNESGIVLKKSSLWDNTIEPMAKGENTKVRLIGTPKGKNKFHQLSHSPKFNAYHFPAHLSPYWNQQELEEKKKTVPLEVWRQEYLAEFIDGAGTVFRNIQGCITDKQLDRPEEGRKYGMSADLAKHVDFTVLSVGDIDDKQLVSMDRFNQLDWGFIKERIINTYKKWNCEYLVLDSTGVGDSIFDDLVNAGLNVISFKFTSTTKTQLVRNLSVAMDNETITFYPYKELVDELETF